jgi:hypothetical protein
MHGVSPSTKHQSQSSEVMAESIKAILFLLRLICNIPKYIHTLPSPHQLQSHHRPAFTSKVLSPQFYAVVVPVANLNSAPAAIHSSAPSYLSPPSILLIAVTIPYLPLSLYSLPQHFACFQVGLFFSYVRFQLGIFRLIAVLT